MSRCRISGGTGHVRNALGTLALAITLGASFVPRAGAAGPPAPVEPRVRVYPLEVLLNGAPAGIWPIVERDGAVYAPPEAYDAWRLQRPADASQVELKGLTYLSLSSLPGAEVRIDPVQNALVLNVRADAFLGARMKRDRVAGVAYSEVVPSAFLNYDLNFSEAHSRETVVARSLGIVGEVGYSSSWGLLSSSFAARDLTGDTPGSPPKLLRLETALRRDYPQQGYTVNIGDAVTRTGYLGRPTLFGGLQIGTNFGLSPHVNRQPLPVIMGQTLAPSTVQLYVNDVLRQTARVPAGPFTLDTLPAIIGNGDVSVVVRDILGRETVITQPFFIASDLLAPDLNDWTFEVGKLREDLGSASSHYGNAFAAGMWRRGLTTTATVEGRSEISRSRAALGIAGVAAFGRDLLGRGGMVASHDRELGSGSRWSGSLDWQGRANSALVTAEANSRSFRYVGEPAGSAPPRLQVAAQAGLFLSGFGRLGAGLAIQFPYDLPRVTTASLSYTTVLRDNWQLSLSLSRSMGIVNGTNLGATLNIPLSARNLSTSSVQARRGQIEAHTSFSHTPAGGYGTAWRVLGGHQGRPRAEASIYQFSGGGVTSAEISATPQDANLRLGRTGGFLYTTGKLFAVPRHDQSAALVHVPGYAGIGVGLGQQVSARTDSDGYALIPRLNAYQPNPIRLDPNDLPITAEIDSIELPAVPRWRAVAPVTFPVRGGRGAVIKVVLDDGEAAPRGAVVRIVGEERDFYVGSRGEAYVTGLQRSNRLQLRWRGARCAMDVELPAGAADQIARVGPISCKGVIAR